MLTGREKPPFSPEMTLCLCYFSHFSKNLLAPVDTVCFLEPRESPVTSDTVRLSMGTLLHPLTTSRQLLPQTSLAVDPCLRIPLLPSLPEGSHPTLPSERRPLLLQPPASLVLAVSSHRTAASISAGPGAQPAPSGTPPPPSTHQPSPGLGRRAPALSTAHSLPAAGPHVPWSSLVLSLLEPRLSLQYDGELREPLVWRQGSQVPMRWLGGARHCSRVMVG